MVWHRVSLGKGSEYGGAGEWINLSESKLGKKEKEQMAVDKTVYAVTNLYTQWVTAPAV